MTSRTERAWLLRRTHRLLRSRGYSPRTREAYVQWTERFLFATRRRRSRQLSRKDVRAFLTELAEEKGLAPRSINQALSALAFNAEPSRFPTDCSGGISLQDPIRHLPHFLPRRSLGQRVGSRLRRSITILVAQQKCETLDGASSVESGSLWQPLVPR